MTDARDDETPEPRNGLPLSALGTGSWSVRVRPRIWLGSAVGLAVVVLLLVGAIGDLQITAGHLLSLAALSAAGGWGIAHWFNASAEGQRIVSGWFFTLIAWVAIGALASRVLDLAVPAPFGIGITERLLLVPAVISLALVLAAGLRLHFLLSRCAAALLALALFATDDGGDWPRERVSSAGAAALGAARESGRTILLRGAAHDQNAGLKNARPPGADHCQHLDLDDELRTAVGMPGRRLLVSFDACWDADNKPLSLVVKHHADKGDGLGNLRSVRLATLDPFILDRPELGDPLAGTVNVADDFTPYGDTKADVARDAGGGGGPVRVFDEQGRVRDDGVADDDTVRAQVHRNQISVVLAYEARDPLIGRRDREGDSDGMTDGNERPDIPWAPNAIDRYATFRTPSGVALDVVTAHLQSLGGSDASVVRFTARGGSHGTRIAK